MKSPLLIAVVPSFWNSVPWVILAILDESNSALSAALCETISPDALWVSSLVVALVTDGVSATGSTMMVAVARLPPRPALLFVVEAWTLKLPLPKKSAAGVNFRPALASAT